MPGVAAIALIRDDRGRVLLVSLTVLLYRGPATGTLVAEAGSDARWFAVEAIPDPHPALRRQLLDAGVGHDDRAAIEAALAAADVEMERLD